MLIDEILPEPLGAAHADHPAAAKTLADALRRHLSDLSDLDGEALVAGRADKFRKMGPFLEE